MKRKKTPKVIFLARKQEWYLDLVSLLKGKFNFYYSRIHYFFEKQHISKTNILFDSFLLIFYFPIIFLKQGSGIYIITTRHLPILLWFKIFTWFGSKSKVVAMNFYFHELREKFIVKKIIQFLIHNKNLSIIVPSKNDEAFFKNIAPTTAINYILFGLEKTAVQDYTVTEGDYIFCGGYNNRDFELIFRVAQELEEDFIVITSGRESFNTSPPANVTVLHDVPFRTFQNYLAGAKLVIIPLKNDFGASGQIVTLSAMAFHKAILYTDYNVISEYFIDGENGISFKAGDQCDLIEKIKVLSADRKKRYELGENAKIYFEHNFTSEVTNRKIIAVLDELTCNEG